MGICALYQEQGQCLFRRSWTNCGIVALIVLRSCHEKNKEYIITPIYILLETTPMQ